MVMTEAVATHPAERILRPSEEELLEAWREIHAANAEQEARLRETEPDDDRIAPEGSHAPPNLTAWKRARIANPTPDIAFLASFARPGDWWFDIGAGTGIHTAFLSKIVDRVVAIEPSPGYQRELEETIASTGADNIEIDPRRWPPEGRIGEPDVCFCDNVTYFIPDIGPFLDSMEQHARRLCVVGSTEWGTGARPVNPIFEELHGEPYIRLPGLRELLAILAARRRRYDVYSFADILLVAPVAAFTVNGETLEDAHARVRNHYLVREGSEKDQLLKELLAKHYSIDDGRVRLPSPAGNFRAIVSWAPPGAVE